MNRAIDEPVSPREEAGKLERQQRIENLLDAHRPKRGQGKIGAERWRELCYEALKETKNPTYVWTRYVGKPGLEGLTIANLQRALDKWESEQ